MKLSEITPTIAIDYCGAYAGDSSAFEILYIPAAKNYVKEYTGLTDEKLDQHASIAIAALVIMNEMYENRLMTVNKDNANRLIESILGMHSVNLL